MGKMKVLALLSGGLDSSTALAMTLDMGYEVPHAISVRYGQRHVKEILSAQDIAAAYKVKHTLIDLSTLGSVLRDGSALVNPSEPLPENRSQERMAQDIPRSYVPGRNTILLAIAQAFAEVNGLDRIVAGFNAVDYSGYPDCRPEYVLAWNDLARKATKKGVEYYPIYVMTPLIRMTKSEIIHTGLRLGVPYNLTWSCYAGGAKACGKCDSCIIRKSAFEELGKKDPIEYE